MERLRQAVIVLGMHRSGTSALAGALGILGARLPNRPMPPQPDNPKGFFESNEITAIHDRLLAAAGTTWLGLEQISAEWQCSPATAAFVDELAAAVAEDYDDAPLFAIKDPRMCRLMPIWRRVLDRVGARPRFAITVRNPLEVAQSLKNRNRLPISYGCLLWLLHMIEAELHTRQSPRVFASYDNLLRNPGETVKHIASELKLDSSLINEKSAPSIVSFVDPTMRHHVADIEELESRGRYCPWLLETYQALGVLVQFPFDTEARQRLDNVRTFFAQALSESAIREKMLADLQSLELIS